MFRVALILLSRVSPVSFLLFSKIFLDACVSIFSLQMLSSPTFGLSFLLLFLSCLLPLASVVRQCVLTLEVSRDGEDGLRSNIFATCQSTLSSSRFTCIVVLMYPTVLLRYSMSCLALIGRRIWPPYRRYLITLWFTLRLVRLREFWGGRETKKILSTSFPGFSGRREPWERG